MTIKLYLYIFSSIFLFVFSILSVPYAISMKNVPIASANTSDNMCIDQRL